MTKSARASTNDSSSRSVPAIATSAEVFPDGSAIELVSADSENLALLHYTGKSVTIAQDVRCAGRVYRPIELHPSIKRAIRLPGGIADSVVPAATFRELAALHQDHIALPEHQAFLAAVWAVTTWFADFLPSPPPLIVSGGDLSQAIKLFSLAQCIVRRGIILGDFSRQALGSLPMEIRPTIMLAQAELSDKVWSLWSASNFRNTFIAGRRGTVLNVACSKALFAGTSGNSRRTGNSIHLTLLPTRSGLASLSDREQEEIAAQFQPQLLRYRLEHLGIVRGQPVGESSFAKGEAKFSTGDLVGSLRLCVPDEPVIAHGLATVLDEDEQDRQRRLSCDVQAVVVEVLWAELQDSDADIGVARVADFTNSMLQSRGEQRVYSAEEIGWQLRRMGIVRHFGRDCNSVRFSRDTWLRIHELARVFGLTLRPHGNKCFCCSQS